jgi:hypothetical protein
MANNNSNSNGSKKDEKKQFPVGESLVEVSFVDFEVSSGKGTPMVTFKLRGTAGSATDQVIRNRCYLGESSLWKLEDFAIASGVDAATAVQYGKTQDSRLLELFIGTRLKAVVKADTYQDKDGIEREGREVVAVESLDAVIRDYMEKRRKARKTGGNFTAPQPVARGKDASASAAPRTGGNQGSRPPVRSEVNTDDIPF